jgi:hypothetical protein
VPSEYLERYLAESSTESRKHLGNKWLRQFFTDFARELEQRANGASAGDRYVVAAAFSKAFNNLVPSNATPEREVQVSRFINLPEDKALSALLGKKRIDFSITNNKTGAVLLIEFKTNVQFNDVSAAMVEMASVKKFAKAPRKLQTASLHLFPYRTNVDGLRALNKELGSPLDHIWVFCTPQLNFDVKAIENFRSSIGG